MNLTYEEQERLAYISGDTEKAQYLGVLMDFLEENQELCDEKDDHWMHRECPECGFED